MHHDYDRTRVHYDGDGDKTVKHTRETVRDHGDGTERVHEKTKEKVHHGTDSTRRTYEETRDRTKKTF